MSGNPTPSKLDFQQIFQRVMDESEDRLRVNVGADINIDGEMEVSISHLTDSIRIGDGLQLVTTTSVGGDVGLDVNLIGGVVSGTFSPTGLKVAFKVTTADITDTASQLPLTPLTGRNSMVIHNLSSTDTLFIGPSSSVTADRVLGTTSGHEVFPGETFAIDITNAVILYGIAPAGKTIRVKISEVA